VIVLVQQHLLTVSPEIGHSWARTIARPMKVRRKNPAATTNGVEPANVSGACAPRGEFTPEASQPRSRAPFAGTTVWTGRRIRRGCGAASSRREKTQTHNTQEQKLPLRATEVPDTIDWSGCRQWQLRITADGSSPDGGISLARSNHAYSLHLLATVLGRGRSLRHRNVRQDSERLPPVLTWQAACVLVTRNGPRSGAPIAMQHSLAAGRTLRVDILDLTKVIACGDKPAAQGMCAIVALAGSGIAERKTLSGS
jgi:hypothetical protein